MYRPLQAGIRTPEDCTGLRMEPASGENRGRCPATPGSVQQSDRKRTRCDAGWWNFGHTDLSPHRAGAPRPPKVGEGGIRRYRLRDGSRANGPDLSAVFHDEKGETRHGVGASDRDGNRTGAWGPNQGG